MNNNLLLHIFSEVLFEHFPDGKRVASVADSAFYRAFSEQWGE